MGQQERASQIARQAQQQARERARTNPHGIGAAYLWRPITDLDASGWRGTVMISDGEAVVESEVFALSKSPYATPDPEQLAIVVELLVAGQKHPLKRAVADLTEASGIPIDSPDDLLLVFA
jgi:hypothetical protein